MKFKSLDKKGKSIFLFKVVLFILSISLVLLTVFAKEGSVFNIFNSDKSGLNMIGEFFNKQAPYILKSIVIIIIALFISYLFRYIVSKMLRLGKRGQTTAKLIDSFIKYFTAILIILLVLSAFGVPTITLLASVGILGLVIGLSAQSLISDIISGLFIVFEGAYEVGDYIVIEGFRGVVESIGIRTTNFIDYAGNIKIINNSEIKRVVNLSKAPSAAEALIKVSHKDFNKVERIIEKELPNIKERLTMFTDGPTYLGPNDMDELGLQLFFLGYTDEENRFAAQRALIKELKILLDNNDIHIPHHEYIIEHKK